MANSPPGPHYGFTVARFRAIMATFLCTAVIFPFMYQPVLSACWQFLYSSSFYRFSGFETALTMFCYMIIEPTYTYMFGKYPQLRIDVRGQDKRLQQQDPTVRPTIPKMRRPKDRLSEIAIYVAPLFALDFILIKKFAGVSIQDIRVSGGYPPLPTGYYVNPTSHNISTNSTPNVESMTTIHSTFLLPTLHNFSKTSWLQLQRALPSDPPTSRQLVLQLATAFFIYDALFFAIHIAFHRIRPLALIHLPHHTHAEMHPQVTNKLSIAERLSLILLANFSLNIIGSHVLTRTLFVPIFVWLLVEVHSGLDLAWGYDKLLPRGWGAGTRTHAIHHRTGQGAYAPFFGWWDAGLRRWDKRNRQSKILSQ